MSSSYFTFLNFKKNISNTLTMCEFHESTCNGFGDIWWTDNPIYFSSIDSANVPLVTLFVLHAYGPRCLEWPNVL